MKHIIATCFGSSAVGTAACVAGAVQAGTITNLLEISYLILGIIGAIGTIAGLIIGIVQKVKKDAADGKITADEMAEEIQQMNDAAKQGADAVQAIIDQQGKKGEKKE